MKVHFLVFFCFALLFFYTSLISFGTFFAFLFFIFLIFFVLLNVL